MTRAGACLALLPLCACLGRPEEGAADAATDPSDDGGVPGAPDATPPCSFLDEFEGSELDPRWQKTLDVEGGTVEVDGGRLIMSSTSAADEYIYQDIRMRDRQPIDGSTVLAEVSIDVATNGDSLLVWSDGDLWFGIGVDTAVVIASGGDSDSTDFFYCQGDCPPYDDDTIRYLRMRAGDGQVHFEMSGSDDVWIAVADPQPLRFSEGHIRYWAEAGDGNSIIAFVERIERICAEDD